LESDKRERFGLLVKACCTRYKYISNHVIWNQSIYKYSLLLSLNNSKRRAGKTTIFPLCRHLPAGEPLAITVLVYWISLPKENMGRREQTLRREKEEEGR